MFATFEADRWPALKIQLRNSLLSDPYRAGKVRDGDRRIATPHDALYVPHGALLLCVCQVEVAAEITALAQGGRETERRVGRQRQAQLPGDALKIVAAPGAPAGRYWFFPR